MSTALAPLRDIETTLVLLLEVDPADLSPELRAEYEIDLLNAIKVSAEKRERVAMKLFDLGQRAAIKRAAAEAHRKKAADLEVSAARAEADAERLKNYVLDVMRELPKPKKGPRLLEGTSATFKAAAVPDSVEVYDESALPDEFRTATVTMPMHLYRSLAAAPPTLWDFSALPVVRGRVEKRIIKSALEQSVRCPQCKGAGDCESFKVDEGGYLTQEWETCSRCSGFASVLNNVPGARLLTGKLRLVVE